MKKGSKFFVCVTGFTKEGLPKYSINPMYWTTDLDKAFHWTDKAICKSDIKAFKDVYGVKGQLLKVIKDE